MSNCAFAEGFDLFSATVVPNSTYTLIAGGSTEAVSSTTVPYANGKVGRSLRIQTSGNQIIQLGVPLPASYAAMSAGFAYRVDALPVSTANRFFSFMSAANVTQVGVWITNTGAIQVCRGNVAATNILATSASNVIITNTYYHIEICITRSTTVGTLDVYVDGVSVITATGLNTNTTDVGALLLMKDQSGCNCYFDDLTFFDAITKIGPSRIETLQPSADDSVAWTRNTGADNYDCVDDNGSDGDTTYVASATVSQKDRYALDNLTSVPNSIFAAQPVMISRKDDATVRQIRENIVSGATTDNGPTVTMTTTYKQYFGDMLPTDPNTASAWASAGINALKLELEVVT